MATNVLIGSHRWVLGKIAGKQTVESYECLMEELGYGILGNWEARKTFELGSNLIEVAFLGRPMA